MQKNTKTKLKKNTLKGFKSRLWMKQKKGSVNWKNEQSNSTRAEKRKENKKECRSLRGLMGQYQAY